MAIDRIALLGIDIIVNAQRARTALKSIDQSMQNLDGFAGQLGVTLGTVGVAFSGLLLARRFTTVAVEGITIVTEAAAGLEEQIRDIEKIASSGNINKLGQDFLELGQNIRGLSFEELARGAQTAARAGVTLDNGLLKLTSTTSRYAMVAGDLTPDEATEGIARLLANFDMGVEKADNLTSAINGLSDAFPTTSGEIQKTMARLSGFAEATNMTVQELAALSAVLLSSGQSATVVRSTIGSLLDKLAREPELVREQLQMTNEEFERFFILMRSNPTEGILKFIETLNLIDPLDQSKALQELGISSFRIASTIKILQAAYDKLNPAIQKSNELFAEGTVNLDKYAVVAGGANAKLNQLHNQWTVLKASLADNNLVMNQLIGGFEILKGLLQGFQSNNFQFNQLSAGDTAQVLDREINAMEQQLAYWQQVVEERNRINTQFGAGQMGSPGSMFMMGGTSTELGFLQFIMAEAAALFGEVPQALGIIRDLEFQINLLKEKRQTLLENEGEVLRENAERTEKQRKEAEKAAEALRERQLEQFQEFQAELEDLGYTGIEAQIIRIENTISDLREKFEELHKPTDELITAYEEATQRLQQQIDDLKNKPSEMESGQLKFLGQHAGRFADKIESISELLEGIELFQGQPNIQNTISNMLDSLLNPVSLPRFTSVQQTQQEIRESSLREEQRKRELDQLALAKAMVDIMINNLNVNQQTKDLLDRMLQEGNTIQ